MLSSEAAPIVNSNNFLQIDSIHKCWPVNYYYFVFAKSTNKRRSKATFRLCFVHADELVGPMDTWTKNNNIYWSPIINVVFEQIGLFRYIKIQLDSEAVTTKTIETRWNECKKYLQIIRLPLYLSSMPHYEAEFYYIEKGLFIHSGTETTWPLISTRPHS